MMRTRLAGVGLALVLFAACGDDATITTPPTPAPPTPVPTPTPTPAALIIQGERAFPAPPRGKATLAGWDFTTEEAGTLDVTISYLYDDSKILVWVTNRPCNRRQFDRDHCFYLTKSLEGPRPRRLTATGVEAGGYSLWVANDGPHDEQIGYEVLLTPSTSGSGRLTR
jgi:hypothetical protein